MPIAGPAVGRQQQERRHPYRLEVLLNQWLRELVGEVEAYLDASGLTSTKCSSNTFCDALRLYLLHPVILSLLRIVRRLAVRA